MQDAVKLKEFNDDLSKLGEVEQFLKLLTSIPRVKERMTSLLFQLQF